MSKFVQFENGMRIERDDSEFRPYWTEYYAQQAFDEYIDEEGRVEILGSKYFASTILREMDPHFYHLAFLNWLTPIQEAYDEDEASIISITPIES